MPELKHNFTQGRMNKDLDERMVPNGEYRDAMNIEISTSEGSDVGAVQTLKGNTAITSLFGENATCVGSIVDESKNKLYWFISAPDKNTAASTTYSHAEQDSSGTVSVVHNVYSDYIMEYDETSGELSYVVVEHYKVETTISNDSHDSGDHLHISNLNQANDIRYVGIQVGMDVYVNNMKTYITKIEYDAAPWNGWRVYTKHTPSDSGYNGLSSVAAGATVTFELPPEKRVLGFSHFSSVRPKKLITGINILDNLLFWTDNLTEPKKINIDRCKYGSQQPISKHIPIYTIANGYNYNGTNAFPTLLIVNGELPNSSNGRLASVSSYNSAITNPFFSYKYATVIKPAPTTPPVLTMSNSTRAEKDDPKDGQVVIDSLVSLPGASSGSSDFFFNSSGARLTYDKTTGWLTFPNQIDWREGDTVEFMPQDDDAGFDNDPLVVATVHDVQNKIAFKFKIISISFRLIKPYVNFRVRLQQEDPLFEFKFPRFAYRWKYEDGEYSTYSPFSEVAFIPDVFDYIPQKGYNVGMTNNLRYLVISGFKPITMPLDVVEIDVLYKESNSPNVYTVDTIKSPSKEVSSLGTFGRHPNDCPGWFGKIETDTDVFKEAPNTLTTDTYVVSSTSWGFDDAGALQPAIDVSGVDYFVLNHNFGGINIMIGDIIDFTDGQTGLNSAVLIAGIHNTVVNGISVTAVALTHNGVAVTDSTSTTGSVSDWWYHNATEDTNGVWTSTTNTFNLKRTIAKKPAFNIDHPQGSLQITTDMIHAALPANQLLRPWDNVPRKALAQEVTGNRVVYGNYLQNYNMRDEEGNSVDSKFKISINRRRNIRSNVQYNDRTALRDPLDGSTIDWWDARNNIPNVLTLPERSVKSLRDYQVGVVYSDEFGRQTPVQAHDSGVKRVLKADADKYNGLTVRLENNNYPEWATHFRYYIKENSNEYYNLAMDRYYSADDGNVWVSFPSSERNKVDEETHLILKKQHDSGVFVKDKARYKILAIENEAPDYIKLRYDTFGTRQVTFASSGEPRENQQHLDLPESLFHENGTYYQALSAQDRVIRIYDNTNISQWYDVASIVAYSTAHRRIILRSSLKSDISFTTDDGTTSGNINPNLRIELAKKEMKNLPEFAGRFFVKLERDGVFEKHIAERAPEIKYITSDLLELKNFDSFNGARLSKECWQEDGSPGKALQHKWFVDNIIAEGCHLDDHAPPGFEHGKGLHSNNFKIDISYHWFENMGKGDESYPWHVATATDTGVSAFSKRIATVLKKPGTLFRWRGDTTVYRILNCASHSVENFYDNSDDVNVDSGWGYGLGGVLTLGASAALNGDQYGWASNHREKFRVLFWPALGSTGKDALGNDATGYNPFTHNAEGTTSGDVGDITFNNDWANFTGSHAGKYKRQIEFLQEFSSDGSYTSDNPAIWETEPKEDIDLDLYNEVGRAYPIEEEWTPYLNSIENTAFEGRYNPLKYYNCFSFANGVESNRIRDDFNAVTVDKGPKASTVLAEQYKEERRKSGLIHSGIYNSTSGINRLNQFIQAEPITKDLNPTYGSIQKLWSKDTNLTAFCEDRILKIAANKDILYNADGNPQVIASSKVLGNAQPAGGDFGISTDPESFAADQYRAYFTDRSRGAVMRMSQNGLTPISESGMKTWFKDVLKSSDTTLIGSYDDRKGLYNLTLEQNASGLEASLSANTPLGTVGYEYGITGNQGLGLTPGTVQAYDWVAFNSAGTIEYDAADITHIEVSTHDYNQTDVSTWLEALRTSVNAGNSHNLSIAPNNFGGGGIAPGSEAVYTVTAVNAAATSTNGGSYYRITLNWDFGVFNLHAHAAKISYYDKASASDGDSASTIIPYTISFSEQSKGWTSFKSWIQETGISLNDRYFTFKGGELYEHHTNETRNTFYGLNSVDSTLCLLFNEMPSSVKNFSSLSYEGTQSRIIENTDDGEYYNNASVDGWWAESIETDLEKGFIPEFRDKEGKWFNFIKGNEENTLANLNVKQFSVQGIGTPTTVATTVVTPAPKYKFTIQDIGDQD